MNEEPLVPMWRSIVLRLVFVYIVMTAIFVVVGLHFVRGYQLQQVQEKFGVELRAVAATTAPWVSAADLAELRGNEDAGSPEFARVRSVLEQARVQNDLREDQVYIVRPGKRKGEYPFVAMLQKDTFIGDIYRPPPEVESAYRAVLESKKPAHTALFTDAHGTFISGLAPVVNDEGESVAILHADVGVDRYLAEERQVRNLLGLGGLGIILAILIVGVWVYRFMNLKVRALLDGTNAILHENYDHRIGLAGTDDLVQIGDALDHSIQKLKERFEMLKFLPRHTAAMIESMADRGVALDLARRVDVVVLESDIRGFTKLSEEIAPEEVIRMLNTYVRLQAELIEAHGGSIDKYMGDAVLAIFEGDERCENAVRCARKIQEAVERRNEDPQFGAPVHIGIGLADGEVVMGNMGSESRMEHTVIGSTVNLAARLCSAAAGSEIVMTEGLAHRARLPVEDLAVREEVAAKGFSAPVRCIRVRQERS